MITEPILLGGLLPHQRHVPDQLHRSDDHGLSYPAYYKTLSLTIAPET